MKTSNIIILSTIGIIAFLNLWMAVDTENKFVTYIGETEKKIDSEEFELPLFNHIVCRDNSQLHISYNSKNSYSQLSENDAEFIVRNDTLFISGESYLNISCNSIKSIKLYNESKLSIDDIDANFLFVSLHGNSKFIANHVNLTKMDLYSNEDAKVNINTSTIDTTNILGKGSSKIGIRGKLRVVRGDFYGDSRISVTGAINTQFSKNENASVKMY